MSQILTQRGVRAQGRTLLQRTKDSLEQILKDTGGLWRGRKINAASYQRQMRKSYATESKRS